MNKKMLSSFLDLKCPFCGKALELKIKKELLAYDVSSYDYFRDYFRNLLPYFHKLSREDKIPVCSCCIPGVVFWTPQAVSTLDMNITHLSTGILHQNGAEYLSKLKDYFNEQKIT
jgi:hypothetical protein